MREVAKALGFPPEGINGLAKALDTREAGDVARDLALDGSFAWLFTELGIDMAAAAIPPGRDGRADPGLVHKSSDSSWNHRPRPILDPQPVGQGHWAPPRKPRVLDASVTSVRHESETTKRYARSGELACAELAVPTPRDNGSPGPASGRPSLVRLDPESGMPVEPRRRVPVVPEMPEAESAESRVRRRARPSTPCGTGGGGSFSSVPRSRRLPRRLAFTSAACRHPDAAHPGVPIERATMPDRVVTQYDKGHRTPAS